MFESMIIAFREGMEAFLIVAIALAYLVRTDRKHLVKPVYFGIGAAVVASTLLGIWLQDVAGNPMTEGILAIVAGLMVGTFTVHMIRAAKTIGQDIRNKLDDHANRDGFWAAFGVFAFITLMITREGMETVLMMSAASYQMTFAEMMIGIFAGLALAALMGYFWVKKSHLINIARFLRVSAIFLVLFSVHLFLYGLHELSETGVVPLLSDGVFHDITEHASHGSMLGQMINYSLVVVPLGWLLAVTLKDRLSSKAVS